MRDNGKSELDFLKERLGCLQITMRNVKNILLPWKKSSGSKARAGRYGQGKMRDIAGALGPTYPTIKYTVINLIIRRSEI